MGWEKLDDKSDGRDSEENVTRKNDSQNCETAWNGVCTADDFAVAHQKYHYLDDCSQSFNINIYKFR